MEGRNASGVPLTFRMSMGVGSVGIRRSAVSLFSSLVFSYKKIVKHHKIVTYSFAKWAVAIFAQQSKLYIEVMFLVAISAVDNVGPQERPLLQQFLGTRYHAQFSKVLRWISIVHFELIEITFLFHL